MDSPIVETQMVTLGIHIEVLDSPDYVGKKRDQTMDEVVEDSVKDIVLDSDEEGNEVSSITTSGGLSLLETKRRNEEYASEMEEGKLAVSGCIRGKPRKECGHSLHLMTSGRRILADEHCNTGHTGPAFCQRGAIYQGPLLVSDSGISRINEKMSPEMNINFVDEDHHRWQCTKEVSRRSLAGDVLNEQKSAPTKCEIMEEARDVAFASSHFEFPIITYADSQEHGEPSEVNALSFVDRFVSVNNLMLSEEVETGRSKGTKSPPTSRVKGVQTLARKAYSAANARKPRIFDWREEQTTESNFVGELDKHCEMGSLGQGLEKDESRTNMPETFDIGFSTQMAAEAMEALLYADPPTSNIRHVPEDNVHNSPERGQLRKMKSKVTSPRDMAGSNSEMTRRQSENKEISNRLHQSISSSFKKKYGNKRNSTSLSPLGNNIICRESTTASSFCEHHLNVKKNMNGRYSRVFSRQEEHEAPPRHNMKDDLKDIPISSFKRKRNCKVEFNAPKTKQMKKRIEVQVHKKLAVGRKCSKIGSDASSEVTNLKRTSHNNVSDMLELNIWTYPKRKRTLRNVARHSSEDSKPSAWFPVNGEENNHYPSQYRKAKKWMDDLVAFSQLKNQSSTKRRHSVSLSKHKGAKSSPGLGYCESSNASLQMATVEPDKGKSSRESCRINAKGCHSSFGYSENIKLDAVMEDNKASETSKNDEDCKKSSKTVLSNPSLIKELTRLGYNKSLPDFLPREARRHSRATACVLFSQHLESNIINQQKKIIARLGFSVASCCSDATHFITDRFLRTRNMLEAIASGKPVVTPSWLESCGQATYHVDEKNYILRDAKKEKEIGFSMPVSLACANQHPLLKGRRVVITPNIKPGKELIQSLVKAVQGEPVQRAAGKEDKIISNDVLILSSEEDYAACVPFLDKGAAVYDSELLLNGIVIQKLEYKRHQLFTNYDKSKGSKVGLKKT